ncbi:hypothetical protein HQ563_02595 [bacterium]|nr:hypothetical protein [bacterium]
MNQTYWTLDHTTICPTMMRIPSQKETSAKNLLTGSATAETISVAVDMTRAMSQRRIV